MANNNELIESKRPSQFQLKSHAEQQRLQSMPTDVDLSDSIQTLRYLAAKAVEDGQPALAASILATLTRAAACQTKNLAFSQKTLGKPALFRFISKLVQVIHDEVKDSCPDWQARVQRIAIAFADAINDAENSPDELKKLSHELGART